MKIENEGKKLFTLDPFSAMHLDVQQLSPPQLAAPPQFGLLLFGLLACLLKETMTKFSTMRNNKNNNHVWLH